MNEESKPLGADGLEVVATVEVGDPCPHTGVNDSLEIIPEDAELADGEELCRLTDAQHLLAQLREELAHAEQWRDLALQFDRHRMNAMALIKAVAAGKAGSAECEVFASVPPIPGHEITAEVDQLRARLAALESQQAASVGGELEKFEAAYERAVDSGWTNIKHMTRKIWDEARADLSSAGGGVVMPQYIPEMGDAARSYIDECCRGSDGQLLIVPPSMPGGFHWYELFARMLAARLNAKPQDEVKP